MKVRDRSRDRLCRWRRGHQGKRAYRSRWRAWRAVITTCAQNRQMDLRLRPYRCWWDNDRAGGGGLHWHIGHANARRARNQRTWLNVYVRWPYYRARRWMRQRRAA